MSTTIIPNAIPDVELSIDELTEASLDGGGVFDILLKTVGLHLEREFESNRLTGQAYASVYAQALPAILAQAIQYTLSKIKIGVELEQMQKQLELTQAQIDQVHAEITKIATDTAVGIKQGHLVDAQICEVQARTNQINAEVGLRLPAQVEQIEQQTANLAAEALNIPKQGNLLDEQTLQVSAQIALTNAERDKTLYEVSDYLPAQTANQTKQTDLLEYELLEIKPLELALREKEIMLKEAELDAAIAQVALYEAKAITEQAQTDASVIGSGSILDKQNALYVAQTKGYKSDAIQKSVKILIDTWITRLNADPDEVDADATNKLADVYIGNGVQKLLEDIGA